METKNYQILILGGGTGGVTLAAQLFRKDPKLQIGIVEPNSKHYYQPAWTLVGAGTFKLKNTIRDEKDFIPKKAEWIKARVEQLDPDQNRVRLNDGNYLSYEHLVVAVGIQLNYDLIPGLKEGIGKNGICTNYDPKYVEYTYECLKNLKSGNALFTQAPTPIKCGGAPQKIAYLGEDFLRKKGRRKDVNVFLVLPGTKIFGVPKFEKVLDKVIKSRNIQDRFFHKLVEIRPEAKEAVYEITGEGNEEKYLQEDPSLGIRLEGKRLVIPYEMMHLAPPQSAPEFVKMSPLAVAGDPYGWVDVDKFTLRHNKYSNVWSLGDVSSLPCAKTGASIRKQAPVLVKNLLLTLRNGDLEKLGSKYNGYGSCPIVTQYGKMVLAEFDYENKPTPSFPFNTAKERYSMWLMKKYLLPWLYWNLMLKGREF